MGKPMVCSTYILGPPYPRSHCGPIDRWSLLACPRRRKTESYWDRRDVNPRCAFFGSKFETQRPQILFFFMFFLCVLFWNGIPWNPKQEEPQPQSWRRDSGREYHPMKVRLSILDLCWWSIHLGFALFLGVRVSKWGALTIPWWNRNLGTKERSHHFVAHIDWWHSFLRQTFSGRAEKTLAVRPETSMRTQQASCWELCVGASMLNMSIWRVCT
jgi:hypothetical protein